MTNEQKRKQITAMFGAYSKRLEKLYDDFVYQLSRLAIKTHVSVKDMLSENPLFHFDDYPELRQEYNRIFSDYVQKEMLAYRAGITDGVALAYTHDAAAIGAFSVLSDKAITHARETAAKTFIRTRLQTKEGLSLSHLVWNYAQQAKSEFEVAISNVIADGLKKGTSAADLGRMVRQYLNNPDMMYRRYHRTVVDAQGNKKDIVRWRRRIIDEQGRVRFVEEPLENVGMGHYRSARKNSERLMRTEINSAYHHANYERWQTEPFVIGIVIDLSPQHPVYDMCDELAGRYPKDFLFAGWHPQCLCMSNPITIQGEEKEEFYRRLAAGEDMSGYVSPNAVKDIPDSAKAWINANRDKFIRAGERGKLGYVWRDNMKYVGRQFSKDELAKMGFEQPKVKHVKTAEEKAAIRERWYEHQLTRAEIELKNSGVSRGPVITTRLDELKKAVETGDYDKMRAALQNLRRGIITQSEADFRHAHRDSVAIREAWEARKTQNALTIKTGMNVLSVAKHLNYAETQSGIAALQSALNSYQLADVAKLTKKLAINISSVNQVAAEYGKYIPDMKLHLKGLTTGDLKPVYDSIKQKISLLKGKFGDNYLEISKKYYWEANDFLGGNIHGVQQKYPKTWKISQQAYFKLAEDAKLAHEWQGVETALSELKAFNTKSPIIQGYITDLDILTASKNDLAKAQEIASKAEAKKRALLREKQLRKKGAISNGDEVVLNHIPEKEALKLIDDFENDYSDRMDSLLRGITKKTWKNLTPEERVVVTKYTETYNYLNKPLREIYYSDYRTWAEFQNDMPILTRALDKMEMPQNVVVRRGTGDFKINSLGKSLSQVQVGDEFVDGAFLSTAVRVDKGFFQSLDLVIVVPKGAKGIYAEPFSHFTDLGKYSYSDKLWNGLAKESMRNEREWIGQRGSKFRVLKIQGNKIYLQLIGQMYNQTTDYRKYFHP